MISVANIAPTWDAFLSRWLERDDRMYIMDQVVKGDWSVMGPDDDPLDNRSPNLVQVALEDTAESASLVPTVRVKPSSGSDLAKRRAHAMEQLGASYMDLSQFELLQIQSNMDLAGFGFFVWTVVFDEETGSPRIEWRDPRQCYPETGFRTMDSVRTCLFARKVFVRQLLPEWQDKLTFELNAQLKFRANSSAQYVDREVTLIECFEEDFISVYAIYQSSPQATMRASDAVVHPVLLDRTPTPGGICPVVIGQRISLDSQEPRGQFDQVVDVLKAHMRLMAMVLDYSDQAVYSDIWVKDLVSEMSVGGEGYIQLGPNGGIGRVQPAVTSLSTFETLSQIVDSVHLGGRWPKSRPGEIDQAIASAKFIEATAGMMNTVIRTMHLILKRALEQALRIAFKIDVERGKSRTVSGVLRNQQFLSEHSKQDIDLNARVMVDFGVGLGRDPAQAMVLGIQAMQTGLASKEFVMENFPGITDIAREQSRLHTEALADMMFAKLLQGIQSGSIPDSALVEIYKKRSNGDDLAELFDQYVAQPQAEAAASAIPSGLGGPPQQPGAPAAGGPQAPAAPAGEDLLAGLGGGAPGGAPVSSIGRLSSPLPGGGFAGTQFEGGGQ